jgi:hypothetical protein
MVSSCRGAPGSSMGQNRRNLPCAARDIGSASTQESPGASCPQPVNSHQSPWVNNPWSLAREGMVVTAKAAAYKLIPKPIVLLYPSHIHKTGATVTL